MPDWLVVLIIVVVFTAVSASLGRRLFDPPISWLRGTICALVAFFGSLPLVAWVLDQADVLEGSHVRIDDVAAAAFFLVAFAWMVAIALIAMVSLEMLWPRRPLPNPVRTVRDWLRRRDRARRYAQIVRIASRHGLGVYRHRHGGIAELAAALVAAMNEAGVTFVKAGQVLSARDDVLPRELTDAMASLQTDSTPIPWAHARAAIEDELSHPIDEVFSWIDPEPLAAASVAQVHAARLLSGEEVVVKIQRPAARAQVTTDLDIIGRLAQDAQRTGWGRDFGAAALAGEFARALREEIDYRVEVGNVEMVRGALATGAGGDVLRVPSMHAELCTTRMIVQERAAGIPFSRLTNAELSPADAVRIADGIVESVLSQIAIAGVFHADLHAGNLILGEDGTVTLIDFGSVGIIEQSLRRLLLHLLIAAANEDDVGATDAVLMIVSAPPDGLDTRALQHDIGVNLTRVRYGGTDANLFRALLDVMRRHHLGVPPSLLLAFRTLGSLEGTLRRLSHGYDMIERALKRGPALALKALDGRTLALGAQTAAAVGLERLRHAPRRIESIAQRLESGNLAVRLRAADTAGERSWVSTMLSQVTTTFVGIALIVVGMVFGFVWDGPMLTDDIALFPFIGSIIALAGLLLVLRVLRVALRAGPTAQEHGTASS